MKVLALIPARGGSKRLPGKNSIELGGKPLISWSIEVTKDISEICSTLVSTDDEVIAQIAQNSGAMVPWLRPSNLSQDDSSSSDVAIHALDWYESKFGKIDGLMLLQPTSPFRSQKTLISAIEMFKNSNFKPIIGVCESQNYGNPLFVLKNGIITEVDRRDKEYELNQIFGRTYKITGSIYLISPSDIRLHKTFQPTNTLGIVVNSKKESVDIDTNDDLIHAREFLNSPT
jgi:CMP-N,N'-diacetyllegionaminic acid synthase